METRLNQDRSLRFILFLAALYHDTGKPATLQVDEDGRTRFHEHERISAELAVERARWLRLSNEETERLKTIVENHMRPFWLLNTGEPPTRRAVYRFFRDTGQAGVDVCVLSMADILGTYGHTLPQGEWVRHLEIIRALLDGYWESPQEVVSPPVLLNGDELMEVLDLRPGPQVGKLLEAIREAQATGDVTDKEGAIELARLLQKS
jgi:putative nucleotidyltransferase with HDIG domain